MRAITILSLSLLAAGLAAPSAVAQTGDYVHHNFCLRTGPSLECAYDSFAECEAAKRGNADSCVPNGPPENH
jgi:hypothetical protein